MSGSLEKIPGKLAREYILKFPGESKRSIAKKLYADFPIVYKSVEDARSAVRLKTGACGKKNKEHTPNIIKHETNPSPKNQNKKNGKKRK